MFFELRCFSSYGVFRVTMSSSYGVLRVTDFCLEKIEIDGYGYRYSSYRVLLVLGFRVMEFPMYRA